MSAGMSGGTKDRAGTAALTEAAADRPERVAGPIRRLNAQNGLFLRAEHLDGIQDYARALSTALGIGIGTGVVYGYELSRQGATLLATAGLAITATGAPLQSSATLKLPLDAGHLPELPQHGYWQVELEAATELTGSENAYGTVCADPCEGAGTIRPWEQSLVELRLTPKTMIGLDDVPAAVRRNWLASRCFEDERRTAGPWVVPRAPKDGVGPLLDNRWVEGGVPPDPSATAVPIGVLQRIDDEFVLDTWTTRREITGPPGAVRWAGHLAMRPWPVFLAQLLQFEDQLASSGITSGGAVARRMVVDPKDEILQRFFAQYPADTSVGRLHAVKELESDLRSAQDPYLLTDDGATLPGLGFTELPPAGYLAPIADGDAGVARVIRLFDKTATLRFRDVRADEVAGAVQAAQHRDRIPLDGRDPLPGIDILRPVQPAPAKGSYGWVAFVRREPCCEPSGEQPRIDDVEIAYTDRDRDSTVALLYGGAWPELTPLAVVHYPHGEVELPEKTPRPSELDGLELLGAVVIARSSGAARLVKQRAEGIVTAWKLTLAEPEIRPAFHESFSRSVILLFVPPRRP